MKPAVAGALILCGAILIAMPALADFMCGMNVARLSAASHSPTCYEAGTTRLG